MAKEKSQVGLAHATTRPAGVEAAMEALGVNPVKGKDVLLKPNFNTADECPGSTHNDTLSALIEKLWDMGAATITVGERSFPPTAQVAADKGVLPLLEKLGARFLDFDTLGPEDWVEFKDESWHWPQGFRLARPVVESECLVSTCCLKTHQYGGVFTMSLKLHVGAAPTARNGFDLMRTLHKSPHMRKMIAELNQPFAPALVMMDALTAFVDGGPMTGRLAAPGAFAASADRVALDAVGLALLKLAGANEAVANTPIFAQEQIARAVELGLGASGPQHIHLLAPRAQDQELAARVRAVLDKG